MIVFICLSDTLHSHAGIAVTQANTEAKYYCKLIGYKSCC